MKILQDLEPIDFTYNFAGWASTFNQMLQGLQAAEFATGDSYVDVDTAQTIDGNKIFIAAASFNSGFSSQGNVTLNDGTLTLNSADINITTATRENGDVRFIGSRGINLLSSATSLGFNFGFANPESQNNLILGFESGSSFFTFASNVTPRVTNSTIVFGNSTWVVPANPSVDSVMRWNPSTSALQWQTKSALVDELAADVIENLTFTEVTLGAELIPVGTIIDIDATAVENWENGGEANALFPGWLFLDGSTISKITNPEYTLIVDLLNPGNNTATLLDSTGGANVKLIKYARDAVTTFRLGADRGIRITQNSVEVGEVSLNGGQYVIQARVDGTTLVYDDNDALRTGPDVPLYNSGRLTTSAPVSLSDAANKEYVDNSLSSISNIGSTLSLPEAVDGFSYVDSSYSLSLVDRSYTARGWGVKRHSSFFDEENNNLHFHAFNPYNDSIVKWKKSIITRGQYYFIDESNIIYAYGDNSLGEIAQQNRGSSGNEAQYYSMLTDAQPYNRSDINQLLPAFLPASSVWPANVVTFESATGSVGDVGAGSGVTHLTIKTQDGFDRSFILGDRANGLVRYFDSQNRAYTRGFYLSIGPNSAGQFGNGNTTSTTRSSGATVWGPSGAARMLWLNYALLDSERPGLAAALTNPASVENYRRRFNWFKPNVIDAIGATTWRTQTGLPNNVNYSQFNRYIKKVVRTTNAHYAIVGAPGDELNNEIWCSGNNSGGSFGNGKTDSSNTDFTPMLVGTAANLGVGIITTVGVSSSSVFRRADNAAHNFLAFETLTVGTTILYIIPGDAASNNLSTQFRLFASLSNAVTAFINGGTTGAYTSTTLASTNFAYRARLKGVYDISAARTVEDTSDDSILLKIAKTQNANSAALDSLSENNILTNEVWAVGRNASSRLAVNSTSSHITSPTITSFTLAGAPAPTKIEKILVSNHTQTSFALDSNGYLWHSGALALGLAGTNSLSGSNQTWTRALTLDSYRVVKFFLIDSNTSIGGIGTNSRLFIVCQERNNPNKRFLFAGGRNRGGGLGTKTRYAEFTPTYLRIAFSEDPQNIVEMCGVAHRSFALCRSNTETFGRLYEAGAGWPFDHFKSDGSWDLIPYFRNIDRVIV